jgi:serine/threonine-protein kinase RsbW
MLPDRFAFVGRAQEFIIHRTRGEGPRLHLVFPAEQKAVRKALKTVRQFLRAQRMNGEDAGAVELVMAEVVNNIIEHACAGSRERLIEINLTRDGEHVLAGILDDGLPMPGGNIPAGRLLDLAADHTNLPEGGFGWFLIRELTRDLCYRYDGHRNRLEFSMRLGREARRN